MYIYICIYIHLYMYLYMYVSVCILLYTNSVFLYECHHAALYGDSDVV